MQVLIGIDDTDNLESRGTGHRARQMGHHLQERGLAQLLRITRHQLLVSPEIPYTSHNSSACIRVEYAAGDLEALKSACRTFLLAEAADGSDAGLCVASQEVVDAAIMSFGQRAKNEVLHMDDALELAAAHHIYLEGLTGTRGGVIGALAGVGLHAAGNDGRFLWLKGIRELKGVFSVQEVLDQTGIEQLCVMDGSVLPLFDRVELGEWTRPVLRDGKAVLLFEEKDHDSGTWRLLTKEIIKQLSN